MILVKICRGTVCHVMGGSDLPLLPELLPEDLKGKVNIVGDNCIGNCNDNQGLKPPFVEVGDKIISQATIAKVIEAIKAELKEKP